MENVIQLISDAAGNFWAVLWWVGPIPIPGPISLLLGTGFLLTFATKGIQFSKLGLGLKLMLKGAMRKDESEKEKGDISPFQALMTALAATVGNGNIAGVASAIASGGPGALFWMWVTAVVGMATKYSEAVLAIHFRKTAADGSMSGGPMHYIRQGFEKIPLLKPIAIPFAGAFALFGAWTALFGTGNMMQSNQMALAINQQMGVPFWVTGGVIAILVGLVIIGGIKRIGKTAEILVPGMIVIYMLSAIFIIIMNIGRVPAMFQLIIASAFTGEAVAGGLIGHSVKTALQFGVRRGLLSNESGLGSAPIAHGASRAKNPVRQGIIAMIGTFIDTIVVCTMTGLVILMTGSYQYGSELTSIDLTTAAFSGAIPLLGGNIVAFSSALFGYSTLLGWYYYGERCFEYLWGLGTIKYYKVAYVGLVFVGALLQGDYKQVVWDIGDLSNGFMAFPNLVGLLALSGLVFKLTGEYVREDKI